MDSAQPQVIQPLTMGRKAGFNLSLAFLAANLGVWKRGILLSCGEPLCVTVVAMGVNGLLESTSGKEFEKLGKNGVDMGHGLFLLC